MKRFYRDFTASGLNSYEVSYKETDLFISACKDMKFEIFEYIRNLRLKIEQYIKNRNEFLTSLEPLKIDKNADSIIKDMLRAAKKASVGPMACVAGAFAQYVGNLILKECSECIVENGGDIFLKLNREPTVGIYTINRYLKDNISITLKQSKEPYGICSSSAKIGPSLSMGRADLSMIVSHNAVLSDGLATKTANMIKNRKDIDKAIDFAKTKNIVGCLFVKDDTLGIWGEMSIAYN